MLAALSSSHVLARFPSLCWQDGAVNNGGVSSRGWGVEIAFPWSLLRQVGAAPWEGTRAAGGVVMMSW